MKKAAVPALLAVLLLCGCQEGAASSDPVPPPKTAQEVLEEQPVDDTHDAFLVDTGGRMGTLLVTTELVAYEEPEELLYYLHLSVWDPSAPGEPIQIQEIDWETVHYGEHQIVDVNFDGFQDFTYLFYRGIQAEGYHCMIWDEEQELFVEEPEYAAISSPVLDPETQTIYGWNRESAASDGVSTIHKWEDEELVCVRRIEVYKIDGWGGPFALTVQDRVNGELTEVFRTEFPAGSEEYFDERAKWKHLDYHGEEDNQISS